MTRLKAVVERKVTSKEKEVPSGEHLRKLAIDYLSNCVLDTELINELKKATEKEKELRPILVNPSGIIEDGAERLSSDHNWKIVLVMDDDETALRKRIMYEQNVKSPTKHKDSLRRTIEELIKVYRTEKKVEFSEWFKTHVKKETKSAYLNPEQEWTEVKMPKIEEFLSEKTGYSVRTIREYLPKDMKQHYTTRKGYIKTKSEGTSDIQKTPLKEVTPNTIEASAKMLKDVVQVSIPKEENRELATSIVKEIVKDCKSCEFTCPNCGLSYLTKTRERI